MREYWHIAPINDGCTVLCRDFNNGFYIGRKEDSLKNEDVLIFASEQEAQEYINEWLEPGYYKPEEFWILKRQIKRGGNTPFIYINVEDFL